MAKPLFFIGTFRETMNKKEIIYNSKALVSTWLNGVEEKNVADLRLICDGNNTSVIVPCTFDNAGEKLGEILFKNDGQLKDCKLVGTVKRIQKEFGIIDIK